jgi:hypothetical protein
MALAGGLEPDLAAVDLDDALHERESDARAFDGGVEPLEQPEHAQLVLGVDPDPVVAHEPIGPRGPGRAPITILGFGWSPMNFAALSTRLRTTSCSRARSPVEHRQLRRDLEQRARRGQPPRDRLLRLLRERLQRHVLGRVGDASDA